MDFSWLKIYVDKIKVKFESNKVNSPSVKMKLVDKSQQVHLHGLSYSETKELVKDIVEGEIVQFKQQAMQIYRDRIADFQNQVNQQVMQLPMATLNNLAEPDVQSMLAEASKISGTRTSPEMRSVLAKLVIARLSSGSGEDLKNILYKEAVNTIGKLTPNQLKILVICYLLRYVTFRNIYSLENFQKQIGIDFPPFIETEINGVDLQHIEYSGCGSVGIGSWDMLQTFQERYTSAFLRAFTQQEIAELNLSSNIQTEMFDKEGKFILKIQNAKNLEEALNKALEKPIVEKIIASYSAHIIGTPEIGELIKNGSPVGQQLVTIFESSQIKHLNLTSVGTMIANTYFEEVTKQTINLTKWIK